MRKVIVVSLYELRVDGNVAPAATPRTPLVAVELAAAHVR